MMNSGAGVNGMSSVNSKDSMSRERAFTSAGLAAALVAMARAAPVFPTEFSSNVTMVTIQPGIPRYTGSYQVWQSLGQGLAAHLGDDGAGGIVLDVMMPSPPTAARPITTYSVTKGSCYCVRYDIPTPPEFEPWAATPPPSLLGERDVDGRACNVWQQHGWL